MELSPEHIDELIGRDLEGRLEPGDRNLLDAWLNADPANGTYYRQVRNLYDSVLSDNSGDAGWLNEPVDTDAAWSKVSARIDKHGGRVISLFNRRYLAAAATLLLVAGAALLLYLQIYRGDSAGVSFRAAHADIRRELPDGSQVSIKKNTELAYEQTAKGRKVKLRGEAHFTVRHDEDQPFVVDLGGLFVEDIGTIFTVRAYPHSDTVSVSVSEGEVRFYDGSGQSVNLTEGEHAEYDRRTHIFVTGSDSHKTVRTFDFREKRLSEIVESLNAAYGIHISLSDPALGNCRLSVAFHNERPEVIVEVIALTLDLRVDGNRDHYVLSGKPCDEPR